MDRENFIPFRRADILQMCVEDPRLSQEQRVSFERFGKLLSAVFHFEFHEKLERLKDCYAPFDPDADTQKIKRPTREEKRKLQEELVEVLTEVLEAGNYEQISDMELAIAMEESSLFHLKLHIDMDDFEQVIFFRRGESVREEEVPIFFGLKKKIVPIPSYERVAIYVKFKEKSYFEAQKRKNLFFKPGSTIFKLFRNIPVADVEMLFPNTEIRMRTIDKFLVGIPALIGGVFVAVSKLGAVIGLMMALVLFWVGAAKEEPVIDSARLFALGAGLSALGAYAFKQWSNYKNRKIRFMKALTDNLYYKNLDNNMGVFHHLVDAAEEEECKEALLAYFYLLISKGPLSEEILDRQIEADFERQGSILDFEVDDALKKLERLGLAEKSTRGWSVPPLGLALERLDTRWDNYFLYSSGQEELKLRAQS